MLFLVRSAFCIGLVVWLLPERPLPAPDLGAAGGAMAKAVQSLCDTHPQRCAAGRQGGVAAVQAVLRSHMTDRPSRDSLSADDRSVAWIGPLLVRD